MLSFSQYNEMRCSILANTTNKFFSKVTLVPPPLKRLSFPPIKDAAVYEGEPFLNYGDYNQVLASADSSGKQFISLFGFKNVNITPTQWKTVNSVKFILSSSSISSELNRIELFTIDDDTTWNESDVNWKLKPTYSATAINNTEYPAGSTSIAFDLTDYFLKTFGNPSNKEFGFAMKAKYDTSSIVSFYSKEAISSLSPVLVISYYDMGVTPVIASINGNILPSFGIPDADIVCSVTPEGQYTRVDIDATIDPLKSSITTDIDSSILVKQRYFEFLNGTVEPLKNTLTAVEINGNCFGVDYINTDINGSIADPKQNLTAVDIDGSVTLKDSASVVDINGTADPAKFILNPVDIDSTVTPEKRYTNADIAGSIKCSGPITNVDIACSIIHEISIDPVEINGSIADPKQTLTAVDIDGNIVGVILPANSTDIDGAVTAGTGAFTPIDIDGNIVGVILPANSTDIDCSTDPAKNKLTSVDIDGTIAIKGLFTPVDIDCNFEPSYAIDNPPEISCSVDVIPAVVVDIDCTVHAVQRPVTDIDCSIITIQRKAVFINSSIIASAYTNTDINSEVIALGSTQVDINCSLNYNLSGGKSYTFIV
jgi:hypothetical protein